MTGSDIIGALLREDVPVTERVAEASIKGGRLPEGVILPALLVRTVSVVDRQPLKRVGWVRQIARVAVTVRAASYRDQNEIIDLVKACCAGRTGDLGGARRVSILTAGTGPDVGGPGNSFEQTQDFRVTFDAQV
jgi:hypothetical protein